VRDKEVMSGVVDFSRSGNFGPGGMFFLVSLGSLLVW